MHMIGPATFQDVTLKYRLSAAGFAEHERRRATEPCDVSVVWRAFLARACLRVACAQAGMSHRCDPSALRWLCVLGCDPVELKGSAGFGLTNCCLGLG